MSRCETDSIFSLKRVVTVILIVEKKSNVFEDVLRSAKLGHKKAARIISYVLPEVVPLHVETSVDPTRCYTAPLLRWHGFTLPRVHH